MSNPYAPGGAGGQGPYGPPHGQQPAPQQNYQQAPPPQQNYAQQQAPGTFTCPKCRGTMRTYQRNAIQIEQCDNCRGIFLDFGELEAITRLEGNVQHVAPAPQPHANYGPGWSNHGKHYYRSSGFSRLFFST
ncbi:MAG: zf-TFIIB domain-containing protein [Actinomycetales bacterium]